MAQNIYDDDDFFAGYSGLPRSVEGLDAAAEWPALRGLLPDLGGRRVVDLGCGFGWFCRWAITAGAEAALGLDLSANMLARAAASTDDPRITYRQADLESTELPDDRFDLAYSSLALHYLPDLPRLFGAVHRSLVPGGAFVFSVEHPTYTAPSRPGFVRDDRGRTVWPLDGYLDEGSRTTDWLAPGVIKYHRTVGTYVTALLDAGFVLSALVEWGPSDTQIGEHPDWAAERERPAFLLIAATRP